MPLFGLSWTFVAVVVLVTGRMLWPLRPRPPRDEWRVRTLAADKAVDVTRDHYYGESKTLQLSHTVLVRVDKGNSKLVIARVDLLDEDFEEQISDAQAKAHAKASTLNAYLGSGS